MAARFTTSTVPLDYATTAPDPAAGFTILMWAYLAASTGTWAETFRLRDTGGTTKFIFGAGANGTELTVASSSAGSFPTAPAYAFTAGAWSRIALTVNGTSGVLYGANTTGAINTGSGSVSGGGTAGAYALGGRSPSDLSENWNGRLAAVKIYAAALTAGEIENEWAQYAPVRMANLYAWYPLVNATDLADSSGNGRALTAGAPAPTTEDGPPIPFQRIRTRLTTTAAVTSTPKSGSDTATLTDTANVNSNPTAQVDITVAVGPTRTFTVVGATRALNEGTVIDPTRLL